MPLDPGLAPKQPMLQQIPALVVSLRPVTKQDLFTLRRLNSTIFPINYNEKFYRDLATSQGSVECKAWFAVLPNSSTFSFESGREDIIGVMSCRIEPTPEKVGEGLCCYVMTFGLLPRYRRLGIGGHMWTEILNAYSALVDWFVLHVQVGNLSAINFYKKLGFVEYGIANNYYQKIHPPDALLLALINLK